MHKIREEGTEGGEFRSEGSLCVYIYERKRNVYWKYVCIYTEWESIYPRSWVVHYPIGLASNIFSPHRKRKRHSRHFPIPERNSKRRAGLIGHGIHTERDMYIGWGWRCIRWYDSGLRVSPISFFWLRPRTKKKSKIKWDLYRYSWLNRKEKCSPPKGINLIQTYGTPLHIYPTIHQKSNETGNTTAKRLHAEATRAHTLLTYIYIYIYIGQ
jgi:hypothetical protein